MMDTNDKKPDNVGKTPNEKPDENGNLIVKELLRIYDPIIKKDFVVKKN